MKILRMRVSGWLLAFVMVAVLGAVLVATAKGTGRHGKPDRGHIALVQQKENAWLARHPLLQKISRSQIAGMPGDLLMSTCWHLIGVLKGHPHAEGARRPLGIVLTANTGKRG